MNKQEAKNAITSGFNGSFSGLETGKVREQIEDIIDQIHADHPQVPLPKDVGEWMDKYKNGYGYYDLISDYKLGHLDAGSKNWIKVNENKRLTILADAWRYGWVAEKKLNGM